MPLIFLLLSGCTEYDLQREKPDEPAALADTEEPDPPEPDCAVDLAPAGAVPADEACFSSAKVVEDPWNVGIEWQWLGLSSDPRIRQVIVLPVVGDLGGDGSPEVVFVAYDYTFDFNSGEDVPADGHLVVLSGADGSEVWAEPGYYYFGGPAIADLDGDGSVEIAAVTADGAVAAVGADGQPKWTSNPLFQTDYATSRPYPQITVADLEGDGRPEVLLDVFVLSGEDGTLLRTLPLDGFIPFRMTAVGDIDLDAQQELIVGNACFSPDGALEWSSPLAGDYGHWSAILDADGDPYGEVAMLGGGELAVYDSDGAELLRSAVGSEQPGPPCVADFDGDEQAEIAWASASQLSLYELDGTPVWAQTIDDSSGLAGCSGYDVDGDGAYELLYADQSRFYIYDGSTGNTLFVQEGHSSGTVFEYPAVADIDADGSAEIVFVSNNRDDDERGWSGVTALGHAGSGWSASGPTWPVHDFAVTNIDSSGGIPADPAPPWHTNNVYRARPTVDEQAIDLVAAITDVCFASCEPDGAVRVAVQVANQGADTARPGVPVALYRKDGASLSALALAYTEGSIPPGASIAAMELTIRAADVGADGLVARADDLGAGQGLVDECEEWNNDGPWDGECAEP